MALLLASMDSSSSATSWPMPSSGRERAWARSLAASSNLPAAASFDAVAFVCSHLAWAAAFSSGGTRLAEETLDEVLVLCQPAGEDFQGDEAVHGDLARLEDGAHAALAYALDDLEAAETRGSPWLPARTLLAG